MNVQKWLCHLKFIIRALVCRTLPFSREAPLVLCSANLTILSAQGSARLATTTSAFSGDSSLCRSAADPHGYQRVADPRRTR